MTIEEAALISLKDFPKGATVMEIYNNILDKNIFAFNKDAKTPKQTLHATLGNLIKNNDPRISRTKNENNPFVYWLTEHQESLPAQPKPSKGSKENYMERDLHPLLCTYLANKKSIRAKTIYHEHSIKSDEGSNWVHPDIVGVEFIEYKNSTCQSFFKATNRNDTLKIHSYELKKEILTDYELKRCFFQTVSNSSWANYSYLVAFKISDNLMEELERLNNSFGIGFILLNANPNESRVIFPPKDKPLDFKTIERICEINPDFSSFIAQIEKIITAADKYASDVKKGLEDICDEVFKTDAEALSYCNEKNIPVNNG